MKKTITTCIFFLLVTLISCGPEETAAEENKKTGINLEEYGLNAFIELDKADILVYDTDSKYEQKLLPNKRIEMQVDEKILLMITECQENGVEMKVEFAEGFGETVIEKGEDYCIIEQEGDDGNPVYDVSLFIEKDQAFLELKVCDPKTKGQCLDLESAKKGLSLARTFKFA